MTTRKRKKSVSNECFRLAEDYVDEARPDWPADHRENATQELAEDIQQTIEDYLEGMPD